MKAAAPLDVWRLLALLLWTVPMAALAPLGLLWLWQAGALLYWGLTLLGFALAGYALQWWLRRRQARQLETAATAPAAHWGPSAQTAWALVEARADAVDPTRWPLDQGHAWMDLGRETLELVARHLHPEVEEPLLELTIPDGLLIGERALRDLRLRISEQLPLSHHLTLGLLRRAYGWKSFADRLVGLYRAGAWIVNPAQAVLNELLNDVRRRGYVLAKEDLYRWLLGEYVRLVGTYAIELYSGHLCATEDPLRGQPTPVSARDLEHTATQGERTATEPLRILIVGRANSGKSSLIDALAGHPQASVDAVGQLEPSWTPYPLTHDRIPHGLLIEAPPLERLPTADLIEAAGAADLLLWVTPAHRPDRQRERQALDDVRLALTRQTERPDPPLIGVLTHIDVLRPPREWQPPYDLEQPRSPKATNIAAAWDAASRDLAFAPERLIPVCLAPERLYRLDTGLWPAIDSVLAAAEGSRRLRCQLARRREEHRSLLRRQLSHAGRWILGLPRHWPRRSAGGSETTDRR